MFSVLMSQERYRYVGMYTILGSTLVVLEEHMKACEHEIGYFICTAARKFTS
jgi:hypothetical protein